jgi:hypothetical protein
MRKFFGILLICLGSLIGLFVLLAVLEVALRLISNLSIDSYNIGYLAGQLTFYALFVFLSFWLIKKGIQLTKKKKVEVGHIEKIMSIK